MLKIIYGGRNGRITLKHHLKYLTYRQFSSRIQEINAQLISNQSIEVSLTTHDGTFVSRGYGINASKGIPALDEGFLRSGLYGLDPTDQYGVDKVISVTDGTGDGSEIGKPLMMAISMANAKASAAAYQTTILKHIQRESSSESLCVPTPVFNMWSTQDGSLTVTMKMGPTHNLEDAAKYALDIKSKLSVADTDVDAIGRSICDLCNREDIRVALQGHVNSDYAKFRDKQQHMFQFWVSSDDRVFSAVDDADIPFEANHLRCVLRMESHEDIIDFCDNGFENAIGFLIDMQDFTTLTGLMEFVKVAHERHVPMFLKYDANDDHDYLSHFCVAAGVSHLTNVPLDMKIPWYIPYTKVIDSISSKHE